jgi:RNA polymerase sigma factor (sigma-70 family)
MNPHQHPPTARGERRRFSSERLEPVVSSVNDAELVRAAQAGDRQAFSSLFERWFDRSYDVAWRIVRNHDTAAEVAQDTFLAAYNKLDTLRDADAFGGWVLRTARNKALNRLEREGRSMAMDTDDTVGLIDLGRSAADVADDIVRQEQHDLVWAAAAALGERDASILDLHLRHDLDPSEIAEALDISPNAAHQTLFRLRKRLEGAIRSWVLWEDGQPTCGELAQALEAADVTAFGPSAVRTISRHVAECDLCDEKHAAILTPAAMFSAVPILVIGPGVRQAAAAELISQGVPIDPTLVSHAVPVEPEPVSPTSPAGTGPAPVAKKSKALVGGVVAAAALVVAAVVIGASLVGNESTEIEMIAGPPVTEQARVLGTAPAVDPPTPGDLAEPVDTDAPPATTEPGLTDATEPPPPPPPPRETTPSTASTTSSTSSTSTTTETTQPPAPPVFTTLRLDHVGPGACGAVAGSGDIYTLVWSTTGADSVVISGHGVLPGQRAPSGNL